MGTYLEQLQTFTIDDLPNLDEVTLGALELFAQTKLPMINLTQFQRPLVVGSGNALATGRVLCADMEAVFADESSYIEKLNAIDDIDGAILISASGSKHAVGIAQELQQRSITALLLTNNPNAPAGEYISAERVHVFPKNREPYTYNTSTYMGMMLSKTGESAGDILQFIQQQVVPVIPQDLSTCTAYYLIVPEHFNALREMFQTKFNELFGPRVMGRVFTFEQTKHAKTVIPLEGELFVRFGEENTVFGSPEKRMTIPLPEGASYVAMMAIGYYFVGQLQKQLPPYFKERIEAYVQETSQQFGSTINAVVE